MDATASVYVIFLLFAMSYSGTKICVVELRELLEQAHRKWVKEPETKWSSEAKSQIDKFRKLQPLIRIFFFFSETIASKLIMEFKTFVSL